MTNLKPCFNRVDTLGECLISIGNPTTMYIEEKIEDTKVVRKITVFEILNPDEAQRYVGYFNNPKLRSALFLPKHLLAQEQQYDYNYNHIVLNGIYYRFATVDYGFAQYTQERGKLLSECHFSEYRKTA